MKNVKIILVLSHPSIFHIPSNRYSEYKDKNILDKSSSNGGISPIFYNKLTVVYLSPFF